MPPISGPPRASWASPTTPALSGLETSKAQPASASGAPWSCPTPVPPSGPARVPPVSLWPEAPSPSLLPVPRILCPLPVPLPRRVGETSLRPVPPPSCVPAPPSGPQTNARPCPGSAPQHQPRPPPFPAPAPGLPAPLFPSPGPAPWPPEASPRPQPRPPEVSWAPGCPRDRTQRAAARPGVDGGGESRAARGVSSGAAGPQRTRDGGGGEGREGGRGWGL